MVDDRVLQNQVESALGSIPAPNLNVRVEKGVVYLGGTAESHEQRIRAEELAGAVDGVRAVENELVIDPVAGNAPLPAGAEAAYAVEPEQLEELVIEDSPEPDLNELVGTTDPLRSEVLEDEPYFPPTDPVIEPLGEREGGYRVLGGYAESSLDRPISAEPPPARLETSDEQIEANVALALKEDAVTTDLNVRVHVHNGVVFLHGQVHYMEEVEAAEEVAGRVAGVREVREQLDLV